MAGAVAVGVKRKRNQISGRGQFICNSAGCGKTFNNKRYLTRHLSSHSEQNAPPSSYKGWKQHYRYKHIYGLPDGQVWSCHVGRFLQGMKLCGYVSVRIDGKQILRHRLNFEIAHGRAILPGMVIDHIIPLPKPEEGSERLPQDDSWTNLQELTSPEQGRKTKTDNPWASKKSGVTNGFPIIACQVASGQEVSYTSIKVAASALGLSLSSITRRIREGSSEELHGHVFRRCQEDLAAQSDRPDEVRKDAELDGKSLKGVRVSTMGRVQLRGGRRTEGTLFRGRHQVQLVADGKWASVKVYNLVAHTFLGPPPSPDHTADHINRDAGDNSLDNIRWATAKEQSRNRSSNRAVHKYDVDGKLLQTYGTIAEAAEKNELSWRQVKTAIEKGRATGGFCWVYAQAVAAPL